MERINDAIETWAEYTHLNNQAYIFERRADSIRVCLTDKQTGKGTRVFLDRYSPDLWEDKKYQENTISRLKCSVQVGRKEEN